MIRRVIGTKIRFKDSDKGGLEVDWGDGWHFTFRCWAEVERMHPTLEPAPEVPDTEDRDREVFGDTLDEPIPDDLWAILV